MLTIFNFNDLNIKLLSISYCPPCSYNFMKKTITAFIRILFVSQISFSRLLLFTRHVLHSIPTVQMWRHMKFVMVSLLLLITFATLEKMVSSTSILFNSTQKRYIICAMVIFMNFQLWQVSKIERMYIVGYLAYNPCLGSPRNSIPTATCLETFYSGLNDGNWCRYSIL